MGLTRVKIGQLLTVVDERNSFGIENFYGININKEFMPTVADTEGLDETKYKVVRNNRFVYSGMQTGRDKCIRIGMYNEDKPILVSPAYTTFEITETDIVVPQYFFIKFLSKEKDRYGAFCSDGSIRSNLDWEVFCDIDIDLPPLSIQQKYVDIYNAMVANEKAYERGLDDLKLVCDGYIENLRKQYPCEKIGKYIKERNERNENLTVSNAQGVNNLSNFFNTKADTVNLDLHNYKIVTNNQFAYNPSRINLGSIALLSDDKCIVSPMYIVFYIAKCDKLLPGYLMLWFSRKEFQRSTLFYATGSVRDTFSFSDMCEVEIPIPSLSIQQNIVDIYNAYNARKQIAEKLKTQIKDICPILIKGSIDEASKA